MVYKNLASPGTLIVLTFAKAGLGHLRVAYALLEGLPKGTRSTLFSSLDRTTTFMHRLTSVNPILRELAEAFQYGALERIFTSIYTRVLRLRARELEPQLEAVIAQDKGVKRVVFVCTHFGLAHQIGELKSKLNRANGTQVKLVVVVTDDSPQRAWSVPEADLTIVPSRLTSRRLRAPNTKVVHYPLSLKLAERADKPRLGRRLKVSLPVSGAAVYLNFYRELAVNLHELEPKFAFYISSRLSTYTKPFLAQMASLDYVKVRQDEHDRLVVSNYIKLLHKTTIAFEVTKPSEQAFKALYTPRQKGGVILLLTNPIGRQEHDNLWFLARNKFIPDKADQEELWNLAIKNQNINNRLLRKARRWRGVRLMNSPKNSSLFINWCLKQGVFGQMVRFVGKDKSGGVPRVWKLVDGSI